MSLHCVFWPRPRRPPVWTRPCGTTPPSTPLRPVSCYWTGNPPGVTLATRGTSRDRYLCQPCILITKPGNPSFNKSQDVKSPIHWIQLQTCKFIISNLCCNIKVSSESVKTKKHVFPGPDPRQLAPPSPHILAPKFDPLCSYSAHLFHLS